MCQAGRVPTFQQGRASQPVTARQLYRGDRPGRGSASSVSKTTATCFSIWLGLHHGPGRGVAWAARRDEKKELVRRRRAAQPGLAMRAQSGERFSLVAVFDHDDVAVCCQPTQPCAR